MTEKHAQLLREAWTRVSEQRKASGLPPLERKKLAAQWGISYGMVNHYMNGREPLGWEARFRFAAYLELSPWVIWPDLPYRDVLLLGAEIPSEALEFIKTFMSLDETERNAFLTTMNLLKRSKTNLQETAPPASEPVHQRRKR